jgi:hypothetical protein
MMQKELFQMVYYMLRFTLWFGEPMQNVLQISVSSDLENWEMVSGDMAALYLLLREIYLQYVPISYYRYLLHCLALLMFFVWC